jgi:hypothetical protein
MDAMTQITGTEMETRDNAEKSNGRLTQMDIIQVNKLLEQHCRTIGELADYDAGWDDARVVEECGVPYATLQSVANFRRRRFGRLRVVSPPKPKTVESDLETQIENLRLGHHGLSAHVQKVVLSLSDRLKKIEAFLAQATIEDERMGKLEGEMQSLMNAMTEPAGNQGALREAIDKLWLAIKPIQQIAAVTPFRA